MTRAAIYARVSSAAQRDAHTIDNQLRALPAFVAAQGWELVDTYIDDGRSAKTGRLDARDGFARLVADAGAGRFDVLVVVDIDRLTRTDDMTERARILGPFQRAGVRIVTPSGGELDLRTMLGELYVTLQAIVAAEENRKRAERVKAGKLRAIAEGRKPAGPTPYGHAYDRATGTWSIDRDRAAILREIFDRVVAGESCQAIAVDLFARAAVSPRGPWERHKVWALVRSRHAVGEWIADKQRRLVVAVPQIVDEITWQAAQQRLIEHGKRGLRRTRHVYLLEGIAVCGRCGSPIAIRSATSNSKRTNGNPSPAAYVCRARKLARIAEGRCDAPVLQVADVDARAWSAIADCLVSPRLTEKIAVRNAARAAERRDWQADAVGYRRKLDRLAKVEAAGLARYRRGLISDDALEVELAAQRRERAALLAQLGTAERAAGARAEVEREAPGAIVARLRELADVADPIARQRIVRTIVERGAVVFDERKVAITLQIAAGPAAREPLHGKSALALVADPGYRTRHEDVVEIVAIA